MGAGHVSELCSAVLDPTFGSTHVRGPRVLTKGEEGGKSVRSAEAVVACMFPVTSHSNLSASAVPP